MRSGNYTLRVSAYSDPKLQGLIFVNETKLFFNSKQIPLFIFTPKPFYFQGQTGEVITLFYRVIMFFNLLSFAIFMVTIRQFKNAFAQLFMLKFDNLIMAIALS